MINHRAYSKKFVSYARFFIDRNPEKSTEWWGKKDSKNHFLELAGPINLEGVFIGKDPHWRFMYGISKDNGSLEMKLYDPKDFYGKGTKHREEVKVGGINGIIITREIRQEIGQNPPELLFFKPCEMGENGETKAVGEVVTDRNNVYKFLNRLYDIGYSMNMPDIGKIQFDSYNCGPLCAYAALCANRCTPKYAKKIDWNKIKKIFKIDFTKGV